MRRSRSVLLPVTVAALVVAGCGAPEDAPTAPPAATPSSSAPEQEGTTESTPEQTPERPPDPTPAPTSASPTPEPAATGWGPTDAELAVAADLVEQMPVEEQAGQVLMARYTGTSAPTDLVSDLHLGGVIVMEENIADVTALPALTSELQALSDVPLLIGVDQEGGTVARVRTPATEFAAVMTFGAADDPELAAEVAGASAEELRALGFTLVFAPDADVTTGPSDPTIGTRSPSSDPDVVADVVTAMAQGYTDAGIVPVVKHFPGHGSVDADSHVELPVQDASRSELVQRDWVPFEAAIDDGVPVVMTGHLLAEALDPELPTSLSPEVVRTLREDLGFDGVVVTDALEMAAIADGYGPAQAAVQALSAGADLLLMPSDPVAARAALVEAVDAGDLSGQRLADAATRVLALALHQRATAPPAPSTDVLGSSDALSERASLAGLSVVSGPCTGPLVGEAVQVVGGTETDRSRFTDAAQEAGLAVGSGDVVRLLGGDDPGDGDVVVALDRPYGLGASTAGTAAIALYGRTPGAFAALVSVLTGEASGGGSLPVPVDGVERAGC